MKSLHRCHLGRLVAVGVDGCRSDGRLLPLPRAHILRRLAQRTAEETFLAQTWAAVRRDRHANADKITRAYIRPRTADGIVVDADILWQSIDDLIVKLPVIQANTSIHLYR